MDIVEYYQKAKMISNYEGIEIPELVAALNYGEEDDHPSSWVPRVQSALINHFKLKEPMGSGLSLPHLRFCSRI